MSYDWAIRYLSEFIGMALIVIFVNGVAATLKKDSKHRQMKIGAAFAIGTVVASLGFSSISASLFNPAYTLGLAVSGMFRWDQAWEYLIAQLLGAFVGQLLVVAIQYRKLQEKEDATELLEAYVTVSPLDDRTYASRPAAMIQGAVKEFVASFIFYFTSVSLIGYFAALVASQAAQSALQTGSSTTVKTSDPSVIMQAVSYTFNPQIAAGVILFGLLTFGLVWFTGATLNPFRDLGPRLVYWIFPSVVVGEAKDDTRWWYAWVPVVMPILAAIAAIALYKIMYLK